MCRGPGGGDGCSGGECLRAEVVAWAGKEEEEKEEGRD